MFFSSTRPSRLVARLASTAALLLGVAWLGACGPERPGQDADADDERVMATIDGEPVTMADVREEAGDQLAQMDLQYRTQRHELLETALQNIVRERLVEEAARERGVTPDDYLASENGASLEVTEEQVTRWYERNQGSLGGRSLEELRPLIRDFLERQGRQQALARLYDELSEGREIVYHLDPVRVDLDNAAAPAWGPADAPVTLTEFSDFQCPYCAQFVETLGELKARYRDRLRVVFRQFPIPRIHPNAMEAAEASLCAQEQERFWEMHDLMFEEQESLDPESLREKAGRVGLDAEEFEECMASDRHLARIDDDLREGQLLGVDGTPALFVNGIRVPGGAVPYDVIARVIDEELERSKTR